MWKLTIIISVFLFFLLVNVNNAFASTCGDSICDTSPPNAEWVSCPQDCLLNNTALIDDLQSYHRPIVSGLQIMSEVGICTIGAIFDINGTYYGITASHCIVSVFGDIVEIPENFTVWSPDNSTVGVGDFIYHDTGADVAVIRLNITGNPTDFLNNTIDCIMNEYPSNDSAFYYKIGRTTGLTIGNIIDKTSSKFNITNINNTNNFCDYGDSGSGIIYIDNPQKIAGTQRKLVGIVSTSPINETSCTSPSPIAISYSLSNFNFPICQSQIPSIEITSPKFESYFTEKDDIWFNLTMDRAGDTCFVDYGLGNNLTMTNSSGNWNYNTTLNNTDNSCCYGNRKYTEYDAKFWCNDTFGNSKNEYLLSHFFVLSDPIINQSTIVGQLILTIGFGLIGLFTILGFIYYEYGQNYEIFVRMIIAITVILLVLVNVWQGLILPP
jgi:hypothetical protein